MSEALAPTKTHRVSVSAKTTQHLRDELRLLRAIALEAADILESIQMDDSEGDRIEQVAHVLRLRAIGTRRLP